MNLVPAVSATLLAPAAPARPRRSVRPRQPVRLTPRGRGLAAGAVLVACLGAGMTLSQGPSVAAGESAPARDYARVVVQPGQTLWAIARTAAPGVDPRETIARIVDLNALDGVDIRAGQVLALP